MKRNSTTDDDGKLQAEEADPATEATAFLDNLVVDHRPRLCFWRSDFMLCTNGAYRSINKSEVRANVIGWLNRTYSKVTQRVTSDVFDQVRAKALISSSIKPHTWIKKTEADWPAKEIIVARNGLVNLRLFSEGAEDFLRPTTPRLFSHWALEFAVDPNSAPPAKWLQLLEELWGDDPETIACLQEIFGYIVAGGTWLQKIFVFIGPKRAGKGVIARVLRALAGLANCAGPTLSGLGTNFGLWPLLGKTLATISDARLSGRVDQAVVVERLLSISGEDALTIDRKNLEPMTVTLPTRILLISNELPRLGDTSGAMASRFVLLRFTKSFYGAENPNLTDELLTELPAIFKWAIEGWVRLRDRRRIVQPQSSVDMLNDLEDLGSPHTAFARERCILEAGLQARITDLFAEWRQWCDAKGRKDAGNEQTFGRDMRAAFPGLRMVQPRDDDGARYRAYEGIGLRTYETGGF